VTQCEVTLAGAARTPDQNRDMRIEIAPGGELVDERAVERLSWGRRSKSNCSSVLLARKAARQTRALGFMQGLVRGAP